MQESDQIFESHESIVDKFMEDIEQSVKQINKGSKLSIHYRKLVLMCNIICVYERRFELPPELKAANDALHAALVRIGRKRQLVYTSDEKIAIALALEQYKLLLDSTNHEDLVDVLNIVHSNVLTINNQTK